MEQRVGVLKKPNDPKNSINSTQPVRFELGLNKWKFNGFGWFMGSPKIIRANSN